jgi:hypothetical protein
VNAQIWTDLLIYPGPEAGKMDTNEDARSETDAATNRNIIKKINVGNHSFWARQRERTIRLAEDQGIRETAGETVTSELKRRVPTYNHISFEAALEDAERAKNRFRPSLVRENARKRLSWLSSIVSLFHDLAMAAAPQG